MGHHPAQSIPGYREDYFAWTQHQAKLLRALRQGLPDTLDVDHLAEEIADLGRAELNKVVSLIRQVLTHLIKAASDPSPRAQAHWRAEATAFQADLPGTYAPSMRQLIDMDAVWLSARKVAGARLEEHGLSLAPGLPERCPLPLETIVADDFDFDRELARLREACATED